MASSHKMPTHLQQTMNRMREDFGGILIPGSNSIYGRSCHTRERSKTVEDEQFSCVSLEESNHLLNRNCEEHHSQHSKTGGRRGIEVSCTIIDFVRSATKASQSYPTNLQPSKKPGGTQLSGSIKRHKYHTDAMN